MDLTHLHLLINHVAVIGAFIGMVVMAFALRSDSKSTYHAAYTIFLMAAIGAIIAFNTGESAEETVEGIAGVSESAIEPHEEAAEGALISFIVLGLLSLVGIFISMMKEIFQRKWGLLILAVSLVAFVLVSRTALLGGKIRHTEVTDNAAQLQGKGESDTDDD
jgi:uncharacterized membrane protein